MTDKQESAEDRAVREARQAVVEATGDELEALQADDDGAIVAARDAENRCLDELERAVRARTVAELARSVGPLTMTAERYRQIRGFHEECSCPTCDEFREFFAELDHTRAALGAAREERDEAMSALAALRAEHERLVKAAERSMAMLNTVAESQASERPLESLRVLLAQLPLADALRAALPATIDMTIEALARKLDTLAVYACNCGAVDGQPRTSDAYSLDHGEECPVARARAALAPAEAGTHGETRAACAGNPNPGAHRFATRQSTGKETCVDCYEEMPAPAESAPQTGGAPRAGHAHNADGNCLHGDGGCTCRPVTAPAAAPDEPTLRRMERDGAGGTVAEIVAWLNADADLLRSDAAAVVRERADIISRRWGGSRG